jgi:hypothetical protein
MQPHVTNAEDTFDSSISNSVAALVKNLRTHKKLTDKRIAVYGFIDAATRQSCKPLTTSLENIITTELQKRNNIAGNIFQIVLRADIPAIEVEYLISKGGTIDADKDYSDTSSLLKASDILITGMWENWHDHARLTIKALEIEKKGTVEITSVAFKMYKRELPKEFHECLQTDIYTKIKEFSEKGSVSIIITTRGDSNELDMLTRRVSAQKKALNKIRKKLNQVLTQKYSLGIEDVNAIYEAGEIVGAEYFNDAKEVEIQYKVSFSRNY